MALKCFEKAIEINEKNATAWNNKGICILYLSEDYELAIECFKNARKLNGNLGEAFNNNGYTRLRFNKYDNLKTIEGLFKLAKEKALAKNAKAC